MAKPQVDQNVVETYVADFLRHKSLFILSPTQWSKFRLTTTLKWKRCLLSISNTSKIPPKRGVYAHTISLQIANMPPTDYVTYVGLVGDKKKTGPKGDKRHLQQRYKEYLEEAETLDRPLLWEYLHLYKGFMWFHYAEVTDCSVSLHKIETALLDALLPPCNQKDFSINISQAHKIAYKK